MHDVSADDDYWHGRSSVTNLQAHLVFVTKYRREVFTGQMLTECEAVMRNAAQALGAAVVEFNGESDHVHLVVKLPPGVSIASLVRSMKGASSRHLRTHHWEHLQKRLWGGHLWSPSYFAASSGGVTLDVLRRYIGNQNRPV